MSKVEFFKIVAEILCVFYDFRTHLCMSTKFLISNSLQ